MIKIEPTLIAVIGKSILFKQKINIEIITLWIQV